MQRVSLFGYDKTTKSLAKFFENKIFYDDKCIKPFTDENNFKIKPSNEFNPKYSDLEIISSSVLASSSLIKRATNLKSEYDYFNNSKPLKIWINTSNTKSINMQITQYLLQENESQISGDNFSSLADLDLKAKIWLIQTNLNTINYTNIAKPNIYILHPFKNEDINLKLKPITFMKEGEIAIVPKEYADIKTDAKLIIYQNERDIASYFNINITKLNLKTTFLMDSLLAMAVDKILFDKLNYEKVNSFFMEDR